MLKRLQLRPWAWTLSVLLHAVLLAALTMDWQWQVVSDPEGAGGARPAVVEAPVISDERVLEEVKRLQQEAVVREEAAIGLREKEDSALETLRREAEEEQRRLAELKERQEELATQQKAEQERLAALERERKAEEERKKKAEEERRQAEAAAKRKAEEVRKQELEAKRKEEERKKKELEARRKAEEEERARLEAKRKEDERRKREAEAAAKKKADEAARQVAAAQAGGSGSTAGSGSGSRPSGSGTGSGGGSADRYVSAIKAKIQRNWQRPPGVGEGLSSELAVKLFPGGGVAQVSVVRSSGNAAFDRSAENAVLRADPLPVPRGNEFDLVRNLRLIFYPDQIR